jgi:hypothetical protein
MSDWTSGSSFHFDARADFSAAAARSTNSVRSSIAAMISSSAARTGRRVNTLVAPRG